MKRHNSDNDMAAKKEAKTESVRVRDPLQTRFLTRSEIRVSPPRVSPYVLPPRVEDEVTALAKRQEAERRSAMAPAIAARVHRQWQQFPVSSNPAEANWRDWDRMTADQFVSLVKTIMQEMNLPVDHVTCDDQGDGHYVLHVGTERQYTIHFEQRNNQPMIFFLANRFGRGILRLVTAVSDAIWGDLEPL